MRVFRDYQVFSRRGEQPAALTLRQKAKRLAYHASREMGLVAAQYRGTRSAYDLSAELLGVLSGDRGDEVRRQVNVLKALPSVWTEDLIAYEQAFPSSRLPSTRVDVEAMIDHYDAFFIDILGTYKDEKGVWPEGAAVLRRLNEAGKPFVIVSNTSDILPEISIRQLRDAGVDVNPKQLVMAGQLLKGIFREMSLSRQRILTIGNEDTKEYVRQSGAQAVDRLDQGDVKAILISFLGEPLSAEAEEQLAARAASGVPIILSSADRYLPFQSGLRENLAFRLAKRISRVADNKIVLVGKPEVRIYQQALGQLRSLGHKNVRRINCFGDTLYTDGRGAKMLQATRQEKLLVAFTLVLSGTEGRRHDFWENLVINMNKWQVYPDFVLARMALARG